MYEKFKKDFAKGYIKQDIELNVETFDYESFEQDFKDYEEFFEKNKEFYVEETYNENYAMYLSGLDYGIETEYFEKIEKG